ncbi:MAG: bifunctional precorrin-2 dehydrogenase/sirohydrochlorin ferrochelatase [Lachnospiraceae bacterium]|nr:bifunctional precorrin-2 dehydrogenase/sirohydrochlorin ferrochelatase [Lachnospiraceae bacterium]
MTLFPFFQDITDKTFLVIGAGQVASGKINQIRKFTNHIIIIAPKTEMEIPGDIQWIEREYQPEDIQLGDYIIGATSCHEVNARIAADANQAGKPVNIVDAPGLCTFIFPSLIKRGDLTVAITSNGKSPSTTQYVRKQMEEVVPESIEGILDRMGELRNVVPREIQDYHTRALVYRQVLSSLIESDNELSDEDVQKIIEEYRK